MRDQADPAVWDGIVIQSVDVGGSNKRHNASLTVGNVRYATDGEAIMARLLLKLQIPFTPNVQIVLRAPPDAECKRDVIYVPDFIFDRRAYVWRNKDGSEEIVHGIEAKCAHASQILPRHRAKVALLRKQRGINVKLLCTDEIKAFARDGALPIRPL